MVDINLEKLKKLIKKEPTSLTQLAKKMGIRRDRLAGSLEVLEQQGKIRKYRVGRSCVFEFLNGGDTK